MHTIDWLIVAAYGAGALAIGVWFAGRAGRSGKEGLFLGNRSLPWFVAGTSMVATTFSSDTPLLVASLVRDEGIVANWMWWGGMVGVLISVFFFARLWRRSRALTEVEFIAQRYRPSRAAKGLRVFKATFDGVFINCIIMASVSLAMSMILVAILDLGTAPLVVLPVIGDITAANALLGLLAATAVAYTAVSGLYGVVYSDLIQFGLAMVGAISLAVIAWLDLEAKGGFAEQVMAAPGYTENTLRMFPEFGLNLPTLSFFIFVLVLPLHAAVGPGFFLQRLLASRSERDAALSMGWFAMCHMILRSWPWIIVGAASLVYFPELADSEQAYPLIIGELLPVGLKGIMVASLLAAFMSTLDTHLNWGASYMVNDIYEPFIAPGRSRAHYVAAGRAAMLALAIVVMVVAANLDSLLEAYKYLGAMIVGPTIVLILRWYWWRIDEWAEIAAMATSFTTGNALLFLLPEEPGATLLQGYYPLRVALNVLVSTAAALTVVCFTSRGGPSAAAAAFYRRMRIAGPGWDRLRRQTGVEPLGEPLGRAALGCLCAVGTLFGLMFVIGQSLFGNAAGAGLAAAVFAVSCLGGLVLLRQTRDIRTLDEVRQTGVEA